MSNTAEIKGLTVTELIAALTSSDIGDATATEDNPDGVLFAAEPHGDNGEEYIVTGCFTMPEESTVLMLLRKDGKLTKGGEDY